MRPTIQFVYIIGSSIGLIAAAQEPKLKETTRPQYQRMLKGEDAKKAADWENELGRLLAADQYGEALKVHDRIIEMRTRLQGADHWQTLKWKWIADRDKKVAALPPEKRAGWRAALQGTFTARSLEDQGQFGKALPLQLEYSKWCRDVLGEEHPDTAVSYNNVASDLDDLGKAAEAEPLHKKALAIRQKVFGDEHPETAGSCSNLASNLQAQGKAAEAEPLLRKALVINQGVHGEEHPNTAQSYNNLAANLNAQGKTAEAQPLYQKALTLRRKMLGEEHPGTALTYNNVAANLQAQAKYAEAEPLYQKALTIRRKVLGEEHPSTALSYNNVAANLQAQAKYAEAEPLYKNALSINQKVFGEDHPSTALSYNNLATILNDQGKAAEAEPLYKKALGIRRKVLGEEHPSTALGYNNLAANLHDQAKYAEAEPHFLRALAIYQSVLGEEHSSTALAYNNLAANLHAQGKFSEAEPLYRKSLTIWRKILGDEHPNTASGYRSAAGNLQAQGKAVEAEPYARQALAIYRKVWGEEHPDTALSYNNLAANLDDQGKVTEAEALYSKALAIWRKVMGEEHPDTALSYYNLAINFNIQGKSVGAADVLARAAATFEASRLAIAKTGLDRATFGAKHSPYSLLAATQARLGRSVEAWQAIENNLARGLLDQMTADAAVRLNPVEQRQRVDLAAKLKSFEPRLLLLVSTQKRSAAEQVELDSVLAECRKLSASLAELAASLSKREVASRQDIQRALPVDAAWITWVDVTDHLGKVQEHWACLLRSTGEPVWQKLPAMAKDGKWSAEDNALPSRLRKALTDAASREVVADLARQLHAQRIAPFESQLLGVRRLYVAAVNEMANIPVDLLTDKYTISYVPSGTFVARLKGKPAPTGSGVLALGDPVFSTEKKKPDQPLPAGGLLINQVVPNGPASQALLKDGDVLLKYAGVDLVSTEQLLKLIQEKANAKSIEILIWRDGASGPRQVPPGKLGIAIANDPAPKAIAERRKVDQMLATRGGNDWAELPGTRVEVDALKTLFGDQVTALTDAAASEQRLDELRTQDKLKQFRYLHLATHGAANNVKAFQSVLILTQDRPAKEAIPQQGQPFLNGELSAGEVLEYWKLDAELVTLSACETALGRQGGGDGLLGFAQAFLVAGSRSVCLSLWKVDDTATALLMQRLYQNLLGRRPGLDKPMPKALALQEAKTWLRNLTVDEATKQTADLTKGVARGKGQPELPLLPGLPKGSTIAKDSKPFAHPKYWAAFILIGDPN